MGTVIIDVPAGPANPRSRDPRNAPHHYEITQIICSPNMEYIATLSREDMKIVIWPVDEEKRLNPSNIIEFRELDEWANFPPFDALSFYFEFLSLHEISDEKFLIVDSRPDTAYEMFDVTNKQHVDVPNKEHKRGWHFLKDGHFVTYNEYELNLYTIVTEYAQIYFLLERVIVNSQPTLMRIITPTGKLIQVDNSHYLSLWDIKTAVLEQQFDDQNYRHLIKASINEEGTLIAFNRKKDELKGELAVYSIKTGIVLSTGPSGGEMMDVYFGVNHQDWLIIPSYDTKRKDENPYNYVPITGFSIMTPHALDKSMEFSLDSIVDSHRVNPRLIKEDRLICVVDGFLQVEDIFAKVNGNLSFNTHFMLREIEYIISQIKYVPSYLNEVYPGKRVTWTVFTSDEIEHAPPIVSAFKLDETTYSWNPLGSPLILEIDGYDLLTHMHISSYLLINDDLIICTTTLIMILTVEPEGKIRMIYSWGSHDDLIGFTDRIEYFESIMERENLVMKYQDGEMIRPFKMMIKDFLTDVSTFSSYSHAILRASLKLSRDEIVKHIVDKSLQRFEENRRDVNILSIVARSFTEIFKFQPNYISKIVDAIHKSKTGRESFEPVLRGYTYDNHLRSPSFSSR
ncbi:6415_t:CDS:2, partial [Acaulospora morrowiae]